MASVAVGFGHSLCVLASGRVFGWGAGFDERLEPGLEKDRSPKAYSLRVLLRSIEPDANPASDRIASIDSVAP